MIARRILSGAVVLVAFVASAAAMAAPAVHSKAGKFDVYADALRTGKFDPYVDGAKQGKYDVYSDGARSGRFDPYTDGTRSSRFDGYSEGLHAFSGDVAASSTDNSRSGDGSLYGYRV